MVARSPPKAKVESSSLSVGVIIFVGAVDMVTRAYNGTLSRPPPCFGAIYYLQWHLVEAISHFCWGFLLPAPAMGRVLVESI